MWWNHVPVRRELIAPRDRDWNLEIERQWQTYAGLYVTDWSTLLRNKRKQDTNRVKVERLEKKVDTIMEAYFGCYSKLFGVESEYPKGPVALNLGLKSGLMYPAIIPVYDNRSISHLFEKYKIKRVEELSAKSIIVYYYNRGPRAIQIPNDDIILWTDTRVEKHEDDLSEQISGL